MISVDISRKY